jgi:uncharacterized membrane protein YqaE (UPF0057 family)
MKILYRSSLPCLIAMLWLFAACSPQYGAHFAPSKQTTSVAANKSVEEVAPKVAEQPSEAPKTVEKRAVETGATEVSHEVRVPAETAKAPALTAKEQRKIVRDLRKTIKGMSKEEREQFKLQVQNQLKEQNAVSRASEDDQDTRGRAGVATVLLVILAILIPPLAVFLHQGEINNRFWISLVLTLLFVLPGVIYSLLVVLNVI